MLQKKICMVGLYGVGKTCLVQQYVHSIFSTRYHSTVGVKIDRKPVEVDGQTVTLLLWDLAGRDAEQDISPSYLRGAHGVMYVADGTRRETYDQLADLRALVTGAAGDVPSIVALNKADLANQWVLGAKETEALLKAGWQVTRTSAKTGEGVEATFAWLARAAMAGGGTGS